MAQTYEQIQQKIVDLQRVAEAIRAKEVDGVVARIRVAIAHYGLTPEQLFGKPKTGVRTSKTKSVPATWKKTGSVSYSDGHGNHWAAGVSAPDGFGKRSLQGNASRISRWKESQHPSQPRRLRRSVVRRPWCTPMAQESHGRGAALSLAGSRN